MTGFTAANFRGETYFFAEKVNVLEVDGLLKKKTWVVLVPNIVHRTKLLVGPNDRNDQTIGPSIYSTIKTNGISLDHLNHT